MFSQQSFKLPPKVEDVQANIYEEESKPVTRHERKKKRHKGELNIWCFASNLCQYTEHFVLCDILPCFSCSSTP